MKKGINFYKLYDVQAHCLSVSYVWKDEIFFSNKFGGIKFTDFCSFLAFVLEKEGVKTENSLDEIYHLWHRTGMSDCQDFSFSTKEKEKYIVEETRRDIDFEPLAWFDAPYLKKVRGFDLHVTSSGWLSHFPNDVTYWKKEKMFDFLAFLVKEEIVEISNMEGRVKTETYPIVVNQTSALMEFTNSLKVDRDGLYLGTPNDVFFFVLARWSQIVTT